jgi:Spy/CpxP family protein refolding chaperone
MASADIENKNENLTTSVDQQASTTKNMPIYDASSAHQHSHSCNDPSHHHHHPIFFDEDNEQSSAAAKNEMLMKRKAKKNQKQDVTRAELIPGHQGDKNIDDLVNFINGPSSGNNNAANKKSKKKSTTTN